MRDSVSFRVEGVPAPQGSKNPFGGESNPATRPWRGTVAAEAARAVLGLRGWPCDGPCTVNALFAFPRPKSHFRTGKNAHMLRDDAPRYKSGKPDLDKLQRAIGDSLTGTALRDDSLIVRWNVAKIYSESAYADITISIVDSDGGIEDDRGRTGHPGLRTDPGTADLGAREALHR